MVVSVNESKSVIRRNGQEPEEILPAMNDNTLMNEAFIEATGQQPPGRHHQRLCAGGQDLGGDTGLSALGGNRPAD